MNDADIDLDLERRLRAHFRDAGSRTRRRRRCAPRCSRSRSVAVLDGARRRRFRGLTLLAATIALGVGAAGWALLAGAPTPAKPRPFPPAVAVVPTSSVGPSPSAEPGRVRPSAAPDDIRPVVVTQGDGQGAGATWQAAGTLAVARYLHTATRLEDGRVLVTGGVGPDGTAIAAAELWDPATRTFSPAGSLSQARFAHTATLLHDGRVLIVGGSRSPDSSAAVDQVEIWDPATGAFEAELGADPGAGPHRDHPAGWPRPDRRRARLPGPDRRHSSRHAPTMPRRQPACDLDLEPRRDARRGSRAERRARLAHGDAAGRRARADRRQSAVGHRHARVRGGLRPGHEHVQPWSASRATTSRAPRRRRSFAMGACSSRGGDSADPNVRPRWFGPLKSAETWDPCLRRRSVARRPHGARAPRSPVGAPAGRPGAGGGRDRRAPNDAIDPSTPQTEVWDPATDSFEGGSDHGRPASAIHAHDAARRQPAGDRRGCALRPAPRRRPPARHRRDPRPRPDELTIDGGRFAGRAPGSVRGGGRRAEDVEQRAHDEGAQGERERRGDELPVQRRFPRCRTSP